MKLAKLTTSAALCVAVLGAGTAGARDLTIVDFGGALKTAASPTLYQPFSKATGIPVIEDTTNGGLAKQKAMVEAGNITWDLVQLEVEELAVACAEGLVEEIDWTQLKNYDKSSPELFTECGAPFIIWSTMLTYDKAKHAEGPQSWADFWNVEKFPGKRGLRKGAKMAMEFALLADGVTTAELYDVLATPEGQDRAFAKLDELKPHVQWWEAGAQPLEWLASGAIDYTAAYNGRIFAANQEGRDFAMVFDGSMYSVDSWTIMAGSENKDKALEFIDFTLDPANQQNFANKIPYSVANAEVVAAMPAEVSVALPSAEANKAKAFETDSVFWTDHGQELEERFSVWVSK